MRKPAFFRRKPILEELEPRILYSADAQTALLGADDFFHQAEVRTLEPAAAPSASTSVQVEAAEQRSHELVFIDKRVEDYQLLVDDLLSHSDGSRQVEIFLLDPNRDGVAQIGQVLAQRHDISAVHLISHGADGSVQLGSSTLDAATLARDADAIARWGASLTPDADLLIYGCDVAEHADGKVFISALSRLTGADVAASTNLTGNADLGGDWKLEFQVGQIDFNVAMSEEVQLNWQGQLDTTTGLVGHWTLDANANDSSGNNYNGTLTGNAAIDTNAGTNKVGAGKLTLDGSGDYVDLTAYRANFTSLTQGTIAGWVKTGSAGEGHIFGTDNTAFSSAYTALFVYQNKLNYWVANSGTYLLRAQTTTSVNDNVWHHVAVTVDATGNKLFIDGSQAAVTYTTGNASTQKFLSDVTGVNFMSIGIDKDTSGLNSGLLGLLDDVRVYDRALSAADIAALATTAPILDATKSPTLGAINEDAGAPAGAVGSLVSSLVDFASPAGQVDNVTALGAGGPLGIAVTAADTANGSWYYSINGGTNWNPLGAVANNNARLLAADANTRLYFQPNANYNGTIANAITFRAWDQTSGSNGGTANTTTNGGSTAFSSATDTASLTVNAVNDAPVNSAPTGQYTAYNTPLVFSAGNGNQISVSDVDAGANPLRVTLTVGQGTLTLATTSGLSFSSGANGSATMTFTGTATAINTALNGSTYTPTTSFRGLDTLQIVTNDQGNTGSGGALSDTDTVKLHVGAVVITNTNDLANGTTTSIGALVANDGGDGISLREAILAANNTGGADYIFFNIAGAGVQTINVLTALPTITGAVVIDGWSSPNYTGSPVIELNGGNLGSLVKGVNLGAGSSGSTIRGLIINRFTGTGIEINGGATSNNHTIQGNWIGLNATGTAAAANGNVGIYGLNSTGNLIGGTTAAQRNVISGNAQQGVFFDNVDNSTISGNYIGTNAAGTGDVTGTGSNTLQSGVFLHNGSNGNVVGGTSAGARNVISGNNHYGVEILTSSQNNLVQGNYIGTDVTGQVALGNTNGGMSFWGAGTGNVIGGSAAGAGNVVAANGTGVLVGNASSGATIQGNYIGVGANGVTALGNSGEGIRVEGGSTGSLIGGESAGAGNVIAFNSLDGVDVANGTGNAIVRNSIHSNGLLGINLGAAGVTANDNGDGDTGANNLQNFPVLTSAVTTGAQITITGTLNSTASTSFRIEFYSNVTGDGTGYGEGQTLIGITDATTNGSGNAAYSPTFSVAVSAGSAISAIVSRLDLADMEVETSEFAQNVVAMASNTAPTLGDGTLASVNEDTTNPIGQAVSTIFTGQFSDPDAGSSFAGIAVVGNTANAGTQGAWQYSTNGGTNWFAVGTVADGATALAVSSSSLIRFVPVADYNGTPAALTVRGLDNTYVAGFSTTAGSESRVNVNTATNGGTTAIAAATANLSTSVTPVNDAPDLSASWVFPAISEDNITNTGFLVSNIGAYVTDVDSGALAGIAVTSVDNTHGTWQYTLDGTSWLDIGSVSATSARLLPSDATTRIRFVPNADWNGVTGQTFYKAWDQTSGTAGGLADASIGGGTTAFSTNASGSSLFVTAVNDAPTALATSVNLAAVTEDTASPVGATVSSLFGATFSDAKDQVSGGSSANAFAGVAIVGNTANAGSEGVWQWYNGTAWNNVSTSLSTSSALTLGSGALVRFLPNADYSGTPGSLTVRLIDDSAGAVTSGSTVNIGVGGGTTQYSGALDAVTLSTSITAVNDAPGRTAGTVSNLTVLEDSGLTSLGLGGVTYGPGGGADETGQSLTYSVTVIPSVSVGDIFLADGTTRVTTGSYSLAQIQGMQFRPADDASGITGFQFNVTDSGGTANGGLDDISQFILITVTAVNDAPTVTTTGTALAYTENAAATAIDPALTVSDVDSVNLAGATVTISANYANGQDVLAFTDQNGITGNWNAGTGILTLTGTTTVANYQTALRSVSYANTSDDPNVLNRTISVVVSDGGLPSSAATRDIAVSAVNDPPVVSAPAAIAVIEDLPSPIAGIVLYDVDAGGGSVTATFTVSSGTLSAISGGGVFVGGSASALTLPTGSISNLNAFIGANSLSFTTALDDTSVVTLGVSLNDAGNTGSGGPLSSGVTNVTLNVTPVDDTAPVANPDSIVVAEGGTATSLVGGATNVKTNDTGLTDSPVNVSLVSDVSHGTLTLNADGSFSYTHDGSENFSDSFSYRLTDNDGQTSTATVSITITPVSDTTPVAFDDAISVAEGGTATSLLGGATNVKTNDTGLADSPVNVSLVSDVSHGTLTLNADGSFSYTHDGSENFSDSFSYRLTDNDGQVSDATVSITISPVSDTTPVANVDAISVAEGGTATSLVGGATNVKTNDTGLSDTPVNVSLVTDVAHGTLTLNADGSFSYLHDGSENFSDSFSYRLTDNDGQTSDATVSITISPVSDATPVANADAISVAEGGTATSLVGGATSVMANDTGLADTPVNVSLVSDVSHGTLTLNADGTFSYTHDGSENFSDSFSYRLTDNDGQVSTATVSITISPVSDATPVANADAISVAEGGTATSLVGGAANVKTNDTGLADSPVNVSLVSDVSHGTLTLNADGSFSYTHDGSENFSDSFSYRLTDNDGQISEATVSITISPVSDATPVAFDDAISVAEGGTATSLLGGATNVKTNDTGLADSPVNVSLVSDVSHGTLTLNADGSFSYLHDGSENFSDSFSYRLTDNDGQSSTATVSITISPVSDTTPVANADAIAVAEGGTATSLVGGATSVMANDGGLSDTPVNVSVVSGPAHASAFTLNADGSFSYTHDGSENFSDSFSYQLTDNDGQTSTATVSITITPVSDTTPVANADAISVAEGGTATTLVGGATNVKTNDTGLSDTPVNVSLVTDVSHGSLTSTPTARSAMARWFRELQRQPSYRLTDNDGETSNATVSISITPVSDTTPAALDDAIAVAEGGTATSLVGGATNVKTNDTGLSDTPVNVSLVTDVSHGSLTLNADGSFSYVHDGSENFSDSFSYRLTDNDGETSTATVSITITPVSDTTPVANADAISVAEGGIATTLVGGAASVMANDSGLSDTPVNVSVVTDVAHGTLTLNADGTFSYVHDGSENFSDSFSYRLTDNDGETSTATVSITITPVSDTTPAANADAISVAEGGTATTLVGGATNVKTNDTGLSDTPVNVSLVTDVSHGSLTLNADGTFSYVHDGSENFSDSFSYRLTDNDGETSNATVSISITPVSDTTPAALDDAIAVAEGGTATSLVGGAASVMANDSGLSDTPVNVSLVTDVAHGSLTLNADGSFSYTHDGSENFSDSFSYQLTDNDGQTSTATVSITISPVSDATPVANADAISVAEGGTATTLVGGATNVKTNDTGLSDTPVNVSLVTDVAHGTLTLNADGTFSYVHDGSENFSDSFSYRLTDNDGETSTATVSITITPVSDTTPVANADAIAVAEGGSATSLVGGATNVKTNDTGLSDTPVNVSLVTDVAHGTSPTPTAASATSTTARRTSATA
ncbi:MAG: tandem-95 repeat protein [Sterolibacteriaceae bacterium]|nr:tandem-95 repeat protein [Sterolibacteriaceae bacterium]